MSKVLGVLGGMGPLASAHFMLRLTLLTPAERDQDHIPAVLWSDPRVPDRTAARLAGGEDPLPLLLRGAESDLLSHATAELMTQRGPRARLHEFPGVGHAPMLVEPEQIAVVKEFLLQS